MNTARTAGLIFFFALLSTGCGKDRERFKADLVPVSGVVKLDDKPLDNATVTFVPTGQTKGYGASGKTDASGNYSLTTPSGNVGVLPGEYKVSISKVVDAKTGAVIDIGSIGKPGSGSPKQSVPVKYSDAATTELKKTVPAGGGKIDFTLK